MKTRFHKRKNSFKKMSPRRYFKKVFILTLVFTGIILIGYFIFIMTKTRVKYNVKLPVNVVVVYNDGIKIVRYDPKFNEMLELIIDGHVVMETSRGMGEYPLTSLYKLSVNEGLGDLMFKNSLMRNLHLPVYSVLRCDKGIPANRKLNIVDILNCTSADDKIENKVFLLYAKWKAGGNIQQKNLSDYLVFTKSDRGDYLIGDNVFDKLVFDFSPDGSVRDMFKVKINSPEGATPKYFSDLISSMGGRVIIQEEKENAGINTCLVRGGLREVVKYLAVIFECKTDFVKDNAIVEITFSGKHLAEF